ncbi:TBC domain protein [Rasamsonia emersonii CBS 393.64]|uniref:TBC domain protein n=1 Tax=Rasamsonia emersonii (strain ATCC 16479 / CBS 393.64 / IMI 116815) TaxID=1408163 RepID=A0A0F4Z0N5_RASE3|nr:TBC domain protein [Rasamsonia emersonii CBS 393.64]KKA23626.1 TBC domain protein [Rasamsonia emersonii CBS 393.64]
MQEPSSPVQAVAPDQTAAASAPVPARTASSPTPLESSPDTNGKQTETANPTPKTSDGEDKQTAEPQEESSSVRVVEAVRPSTGIVKGSKAALPSDNRSSRSLKSPRSIPSIVVDDAASRPSSRWSERKWGILKGRKSTESELRPRPAPPAETSFQGIELSIPTGGLDDLTVDSMEFSKRGSLLNEQQSVAPSTSASNEPPTTVSTASPRKRAASSLRVRQSVYSTRAISADEDMLSRRVRLMYERGEEDVSDADVSRAMAQENGVLWEEPSPTEDGTDAVSDRNASTTDFRSVSSIGTKSAIKREAHELAGGIEDWQNLEAGDVDRYGFIIPRATKDSQEPCADAHPMQRVSTSLLIASETPRRRHILMRAPSSIRSSRSLTGKSPTRNGSRHSVSSNRPNSSQSAYSPSLRRSPSKFRYAANRLPHNKDRRFRDEAGDMLTLPFEVLEASQDTPATLAMKRKDPSADELIQAYHEFQEMSSPDDVQIDLDVPRTISSHIMFRRRYRGGQRLLFRVLHAMSLYFPDTGYVQGMAALAATLLSYYDEEHAFIMLVRLWQLRGLERLYKPGFAGLMEALNDFEKEWLAGGEVAEKLNQLGITPTAYGTRWYLTLFNYSIPFPAQLRVWDVFMLLGDCDEPDSEQPGTSRSSFGKGLDVLHATAAALIDGMREIILESDFENAMKVLTSWVPIKDIELFMRVARAEYKVHRHRKKAG